MIKRVSLLFILILVLISVGCSSKTDDLKTEDELKAEIRAEIEAEEKLKEAIKAEVEAQIQANQKNKGSKSELEEPDNFSILNYEGKGLEKLEKIEVDCKAIVEEISNDKSFRLWGDDTSDTIAIFGEVHNFEIGYAKWRTEYNYRPLKNLGAIKNSQITIHRGSSPDDMILVTFTDGGMRKHTYHLMTDENFVSKYPDKQELVTDVSEKEKKPSAYKPYDIDSIMKYMGMTEAEFMESNSFGDVEKEYDDYMGYTYLKILNEPAGYNITFKVSPYNEQLIEDIIVEASDNYNNIEDDDKVSFFGVDFDMTIYGARYNLKNSDENISIEFGRKYDEKTGEPRESLRSIFINKK